MEDVKKIVVCYLTKQIENFEQLELLNALPEAEKKEKAHELRFLMSQTHPYADEQKLKKILFSESHLQAFVMMVELAIDVCRQENQKAKIVDSSLFIEKMVVSVLNGMFNPSLTSTVKYV